MRCHPIWILFAQVFLPTSWRRNFRRLQPGNIKHMDDLGHGNGWKAPSSLEIPWPRWMTWISWSFRQKYLSCLNCLRTWTKTPPGKNKTYGKNCGFLEAKPALHHAHLVSWVRCMTVYRLYIYVWFYSLIFQCLHIFAHLHILLTINVFKSWAPVDATNISEHITPYQSLLNPYALHILYSPKYFKLYPPFFCWLVGWGTVISSSFLGSMSCSGLGWWSWCLEPSQHLGLWQRRRTRTPSTAGSRGARMQQRSSGAQLRTTAVCAQSSWYFGYAGWYRIGRWQMDLCWIFQLKSGLASFNLGLIPEHGSEMIRT